MVAAVGFLAACVLSYLSIRTERNAPRHERWADYCFLLALLTLFAAVALFYIDAL